MKPSEIKQSISLTVLSDNHAAEGLASEHGFAVWIEVGGKNILFDTGNASAMPLNAKALGVEMSKAGTIVLSHGHYDHSGNLRDMLKKAPLAVLYLHPAALRQRYSIHENAKPIGMPESAVTAVSGLTEQRLKWVTAPEKISDRIWLTGPVPRVTNYEDTGGPFFKDADGRCPDGIPDDLSLWIETDAGLVVCLGCCHSGVVNTLNYIVETSGERRIRCVLGGMHLLHAPQERLERTSAALLGYNIPRVIPCHCTGEQATKFLAKVLGNTVEEGYAGLKIRV